jgi:uncharacterized protein with PQ loop repeat
MLHHAHLETKKKKAKSNGDKVLDRIVMIVSILYPLSAVPQLIEIVHGNAEGVSVLSWLSFFACASLFLVYGLRHRVMPMIVSNSLWVVVDGLVVVSLLVINA